MRHILVFSVSFHILSITRSHFRLVGPTRKETITKFGRSNLQPNLLEPGWKILIRSYIKKLDIFAKQLQSKKQ